MIGYWFEDCSDDVAQVTVAIYRLDAGILQD